MDNLQLFDFNGQKNQIVIVNGKKRIVGADCCVSLGYTDGSDALYKLKRKEPELQEISTIADVARVNGKTYKMDTYDLQGMMLLCMVAETNKGRAFRKKASKYLAEQIENSYIVPKNYHEALYECAKLEKERLQLTEKIAIDAPKVAHTDHILTSDDTLSVWEASRRLQKKGIKNFGEHKLYGWLRDNGFVGRDKKKGTWNLPLQSWIERGFFVTNTSGYEGNSGYHPKEVCRITQEGFVYVLDKIKKSLIDPQMELEA